MKLYVDLNADLGEGAGHDEQLFELVTSANIATGFHAGDANTMHAAVLAAKGQGVSVGAHPSLFDRENFGRKELTVTVDEVLGAVTYQLGVFQAVTEAAGIKPNHVKPHGALYNMAARDENLAEAIARAVKDVDSTLILFAPDNSALSRAGEAHGLEIAREAFADRNYLANGSLVPRSRADAFLHDPDEAAGRVLRMLREGKVQSVDGTNVDLRAETICVHGDNPAAVEFVRALREALQREGVEIRAPRHTA
jgi:5-oxoprolinase (ATP-hydrolysing) subunit A